MKVIEKRDVTVCYCDFCKKEITSSSWTVIRENDKEFHYCHNYDEPDCYDKLLNK